MRKQPPSKLRFALLLILVAGSAWARGAPPANGQRPAAGRHVDLVIALDTSGSMDGLIDAARQKLWDVVSLLGQARPQPILRVGLISYGNDGYEARAGWVRKDAELTSDLDSVYAKLFALRTNGGSEYVARAVQAATQRMQWDQDGDALRIIFVAGNEPANQDPQVTVESAVQAARERKIFVNSIYCGSPSAGEASGWQAVANLGAGKYAAIDQNRVVAIATPMDAELTKLSNELNGTYVPYGASGHAHAEAQKEQDKNAAGAGVMAAPTRAMAKASALYRNDSWDLVDGAAAGKDVKSIPAAQLPASLRAMAPAEREEYVAAKSGQRRALKTKITALSQQREQYLAEERKKHAAGAATFDDALVGAVKIEATSSGFSFAK